MRTIAIISTLLLLGCTPKLQRAVIEAPEQYIYTTVVGDTVVLQQQWWQMFGDTTLNRIITTALAKNKNILQAISRIEQSKAALRSARSQYLPSVSLGRSAGVQGNGSIVQQYIVEPIVSWEIPLFGMLKNNAWINPYPLFF